MRERFERVLFQVLLERVDIDDRIANLHLEGRRPVSSSQWDLRPIGIFHAHLLSRRIGIASLVEKGASRENT
jgi:hypothetical protein